MPEIRVIVAHRGQYLIAQCLEKDVSVQGKTLAETMDNLALTLAGHIEWDRELGIEPLSQVPPAPQAVQDVWDRCGLSLGNPPVVMREDTPAMREATTALRAAKYQFSAA